MVAEVKTAFSSYSKPPYFTNFLYWKPKDQRPKTKKSKKKNCLLPYFNFFPIAFSLISTSSLLPSLLFQLLPYCLLLNLESLPPLLCVSAVCAKCSLCILCNCVLYLSNKAMEVNIERASKSK
jgi:hypothetical protein